MNNIEEAGFKDAKVVSNVLVHGIRCAKIKGLVAEFGVYSGTTIRQIAKTVYPDIVHGFDSFIGLPEPWVFSDNITHKPGHFNVKGNLPIVPSNVEFHVGWFKDTLPLFLEVNKEPFRFIHIDSDLYSSAMDVLMLCRTQIITGTIIVFDEYCDWNGSKYTNWREGEYKALHDSGLEYIPLARNNTYRAAVQIVKE
jgi:hypothetical protein